MKTIIKIHDTEWFKEHCIRVNVTHVSDFIDLKPKYDSWKDVTTVRWPSCDFIARQLEGKVLEVESDSGTCYGHISGARYFARGYWIPNWAIEWVKEVDND